MRNGLDISSASELVHEIGIKPEEAVIDFHTSAVPSLDGAEVTIGTAHHGTQRMARSFRVPFGAPGSEREYLSDLEGAVAAIGACVLITHVHGYSARGFTVTTLRLHVTASVDVNESGRWSGDPRAIHDMRYIIEIDADGPEAGVVDVSTFVSCFSPNHRAFIDEGEVQLHVGIGGAPEVRVQPPAVSPSEDSQSHSVEISAELTWEYGTETHIVTSSSAAASERSIAPKVIVDQSKQMLGIDCGPNPQELLLASMTADLVQRVRALAEEEGLQLRGLRVEGSGRLDIRGMLNVSRDIPTRFHNINVVVRCDDGAEPDVLAKLACEAAKDNVIIATLGRRGEVGLEVRPANGQPSNFVSNQGKVDSFLAEMAARQEAAARQTDQQL